MLSYITTGESHGKCLVTVVDGLPYGTPFDLDYINDELLRRQGGYGRGARMKIERDEAEIISGVKDGKTIGSPVTLMIPNKVQNIDKLSELNKLRPGHADFAGVSKYGQTDARDISERASARETAARVAAGALANHFLSNFDINVLGYPREIAGLRGEFYVKDPKTIVETRNKSIFYIPDTNFDEKLKKKIDEIRMDGDTAGGIIEISVFGIPPGLGSYSQWYKKLSSKLAAL